MHNNTYLRQMPLILIAAVSAALCVYVFYPGYIYSDIFDQYQQAVKSSYTDWHPPIIAYMWRVQLLTLGSGDWFFAFLYVSAALSLYLLLRNLQLVVSIPTFLILFFSPIFFGQLGSPAKDVVLAVLLLTIVSFITTIEGKLGTVPIKLSVIILSACAAALLTRNNAPFIVIPIVIYLTIGWSFTPARIALYAALTLLAIGISGPINQKIFKAKASGAAASLQIFDIGGISHFSEQNLIPGDWTEKERTEIVSTCYTPISWDNYAWGDCKFVLKAARDPHLSSIWVHSILKNPVPYIKHRITYFNEFLRFIGDYESFRSFAWTDPGYADRSFPGEYEVHKLYVELMDTYPKQPWNLPFIWLALALGLMIASSPCKTTTQKLINCLSFASCAYIGAYLVIGVASDFRYVLPSAYLVIACLLLWCGRREAIGTKTTVAAGGLVCISIIASGAFL